MRRPWTQRELELLATRHDLPCEELAGLLGRSLKGVQIARWRQRSRTLRRQIVESLREEWAVPQDALVCAECGVTPERIQNRPRCPSCGWYLDVPNSPGLAPGPDQVEQRAQQLRMLAAADTRRRHGGRPGGAEVSA